LLLKWNWAVDTTFSFNFLLFSSFNEMNLIMWLTLGLNLVTFKPNIYLPTNLLLAVEIMPLSQSRFYGEVQHRNYIKHVKAELLCTQCSYMAEPPPHLLCLFSEHKTQNPSLRSWSRIMITILPGIARWGREEESVINGY
jgi:hypothetical protein